MYKSVRFILRKVRPVAGLVTALLIFNLIMSALVGGTVSAQTLPPGEPGNNGVPGSLGRTPGDPGLSRVRPTTATVIRSNLPGKVDYSAMMPPVGNQGSQGSCVAWATGYYLKTFQERKRHHWTVNTTDHQFSPAFIYNQINYGYDNGSYPSSAFSLMINKGADTLKDFPYKQTDYTTQPTAAQLANAAPYKAASQFNPYLRYNDPDHTGIDVLRQQLANGDLFVIGLPVYHEFDNAQNNLDYVITHVVGSTENPRGYHEITAVGYDDSRQAFRIVNQWGSWWGNGGYSWLSYDFIRNFSLDTTALVEPNQLSFLNYPATTPTVLDQANLTFTTSRPTTATVQLNGTTVITTSALTDSYSLNLTGLTDQPATAIVTITDANGEYTSAALNVPPAMLKVSVPTDNGNVTADGTLAKALKNATSGQTIMVALPGGGHTIAVNGSLPPLADGVRLIGSSDCTTPVTIDGQNVVDIGLTLKGNNTLTGVKITRFKLKQIDLQGQNTHWQCSGASRT